MIRNLCATLSFLLAATLPTNSEPSFLGSWCVDEQSLNITFRGADTVAVTNFAKDGSTLLGTYQKKDSTFVTTLIKEDIVIKMGYQYRFKDRNTIKAKPLYIIVSGDTVDHPNIWLTMNRCKPDSIKSSVTPARTYY